MSLVIAKILNGHIRIESDSRILFNNYSEGHFLGRVKAIIVSAEIAICSAGNIFYFERVITRIKELQINVSVEFILQIILEENIESNDGTSFLFCLTGKQNKLIKIENGNIERNLTTAWIGDKKGFDKFQSHFIPVSSSGLVKRLGLDYIMWESFKGVIEYENIDTVGDIQISIISDKGAFKYTGIGTSVPSEKSIKENIKKGIYPIEKIPLEFSAKNGDYEVKFLPSTDGFSFGLYYSLGNFGVFIKPFSINSFSILSNCTIKNFCERVEAEFQSQLIRRE